MALLTPDFRRPASKAERINVLFEATQFVLLSQQPQETHSLLCFTLPFFCVILFQVCSC